MMEGSKIASSNRRCSRECSVGMASLLCCLSLSTVIIGSLVSLHFARSVLGIIRPPYSFSSGICTSDEELMRRASEPVQWGRCSMVDAERQLLANALLNPSNDRFVLLSESCIPLFNFPTVYHHLTASSLSFVGSFDDPSKAGRGRYSPRMHPNVTLEEWRKGLQWFEHHRRLAASVVSDCRYYPVFREHCRPPCYVDEHYLPTPVTKLFPGINANRSLTWVDWSRGGAHPATYRCRDVSVGLMERMRNGSKCAYSNNATNTTTMAPSVLPVSICTSIHPR